MRARGNLQAAAPYVEQFARMKGGLPGHDLPWLAELREAAIGRFSDLGFATPKVEEWKFTNLAPLTKTVFRPADAEAPVAAEAIAPHLLADVPSHRLVFVDGRFRPDLSQADDLPQGVELRSLAAVLADEPAALESHLGRVGALDGMALLALNTALMRDGAVLRLARGAVLEHPLHLLFLTTPEAASAAMHLRNLIVAEPGSQATVVESYVGAADGDYWTNVVTEVAAAEDAVIRHYRLQREGPGGFHLANTQVHLREKSRYSSFVLSVGGRLSRNEIHAALDGPAAECRLQGVYLARGNQHMDHSTWIDHRTPRAFSQEVYKGVLDDKSHGVFQGKIIVRPDAQNTDAHQLNRNILLSKKAQVDTKPELEIHADDVKCSHGATAGELDKDAMFYLRSRGLDEGRARSLLIEAFVGEILDGIESKAVAPHLRQVVSAWLSGVETKEA